jgi:hypothetical protein
VEFRREMVGTAAEFGGDVGPGVWLWLVLGLKLQVSPVNTAFKSQTEPQAARSIKANTFNTPPPHPLTHTHPHRTAHSTAACRPGTPPRPPAPTGTGSSVSS